MKDLAKEFNLTSTIIQNINSGKTYYNENLTYPLRYPKTGARKLTDEQAREIINIIKLCPQMSLAQIGREIGLSSKTISSINCGTIYRQKDEQYPIRHK